MDEIDLDNLLEGELSLQNRDIIYNAILNDLPIYLLDYSKKILFYSIPSYILNQNLCFGQPINPLNINLKMEYENVFNNFKKSHTGCFRCLNKFSSIEMNPDGRYMSEEKIMYLPKWIESQLLFENEPIRLPVTVEEFFTFYIIGNMHETSSNIIKNWNNFHQKDEMIKYFQEMNNEYELQHLKWYENLSQAKRLRYKIFCGLKPVVKKKCYKRKLNDST